MVDAVLARLRTLHPRLIDLALDRVRRLLAALDHPERALPPVIHVAGTNGKGSTVATLRAIAEAAGLSVHVYTSPHLVRFVERIRVAGKLIEDSEAIALLEECERANGGLPITEFELVTAAAFLAFARTPADLCLVEVGLGGRWDATNVIDHPAVTVITPVSYDHQAFLGDTLTLIAGEKAGIIKPGVPCVVSRQAEEALGVIEAQAAALEIVPLLEDRDWSCRATPGGMRFAMGDTVLDLPRPALPGAHQIHNAGAAIAAALEVNRALPGAPLTPAAITRGVTQTQWPARLQRLSPPSRPGFPSTLTLPLKGGGDSIAKLPPPWRGRAGVGGTTESSAARSDYALETLIPPGWELWLDGAHNPAGAEVLAAMARTWREQPLDLVVGMLKTHDAAAFLAHFAGLVRTVRTVAIPDAAQSRTAEEMAQLGIGVGLAAAPAPDIPAALADLAAQSGPARILICGSLYLAGAVLGMNGTAVT